MGIATNRTKCIQKYVFAYESILTCLYLALLFVAYKYIKIRGKIYVNFILCNILLPFNLKVKF